MTGVRPLTHTRKKFLLIMKHTNPPLSQTQGASDLGKASMHVCYLANKLWNVSEMYVLALTEDNTDRFLISQSVE